MNILFSGLLRSPGCPEKSDFCPFPQEGQWVCNMLSEELVKNCLARLDMMKPSFFRLSSERRVGFFITSTLKVNFDLIFRTALFPASPTPVCANIKRVCSAVKTKCLCKPSNNRDNGELGLGHSPLNGHVFFH